MDPRLAQYRSGIARVILENPAIITPLRRALANDDFGGQARTGALEEQTQARVKLAHESSSIPKNSETPAGLDTALSMYVLTDYRAPLLEGDEFSAEGEHWTVGPINTLRFLGCVYATEAPLTKRTPVPIPAEEP